MVKDEISRETRSLPAAYLIEDPRKMWPNGNACAQLGGNFMASLKDDEIDAELLEHVGQ